MAGEWPSLPASIAQPDPDSVRFPPCSLWGGKSAAGVEKMHKPASGRGLDGETYSSLQA